MLKSKKSEVNVLVIKGGVCGWGFDIAVKI